MEIVNFLIRGLAEHLVGATGYSQQTLAEASKELKEAAARIDGVIAARVDAGFNPPDYRR